MAAGDASYLPARGQAWRVIFPILDADGDLVSGASALDSEISKDAGTFADCTNEATEIATSSGMYYLDLTATEMDADSIAIIVKSTEGKTTPIVAYPGTPLAHSQAQIVRGTIDTAGFTATTTEFEADDITEATADHYNGRVALFTSGVLAGQAAPITDYALTGGRGHFTVDLMTEAPGDNDTFVVI